MRLLECRDLAKGHRVRGGCAFIRQMSAVAPLSSLYSSSVLSFLCKTGNQNNGCDTATVHSYCRGDRAAGFWHITLIHFRPHMERTHSIWKNLVIY